MSNPSTASALARAFLAGEQTVEQVVLRAAKTLNKPLPSLPKMARRYLNHWLGRTRPRHSEVVKFLLRDKSFSRIPKLAVAERLIDAQEMQPIGAAASWDLPAIETAGALAEWLSISVAELEWFADLKALGYKNKDKPLLRHFRYWALTKKHGAIRLIESPKPRLKALQRTILSSILNRIPLHEAVHGFRAGHSIKTFAAPHAGQRVVLRMDLRDFFPSISGARIQTFFRTAGYPEEVADLLGGICTNDTPRDIWTKLGGNFEAAALQEAAAYYARPHLPQGAPTSPALANACAYRIDLRLAGLARSAEAKYTRYADDLAFSGGVEFDRHVDNFASHVAAIVDEEGFAVQHHKTRIMRRGVQQRIAGLVTNQHMNVPRADFDRLKATLTNCIRRSPKSQNLDGHRDYRSHLQGRVAFVEMINPAKGIRLRKLFDQISWG